MNYCDENGCQNRKRNLVEPKKSKAATFILGQIDKAIEKSTLEQQIEKLEAEKKELLEALEKATDLLEAGFPEISAVKDFQSLIKKHKS
ncbi:hypothetical protein H0S70_07080 [Chryseobacterium manosquense]|uniref:Uncharacterized protein n=1 Tax=Chryseobacterium manosquense TaxID=2754694 RepID=A0A7H1DT61_9FLAO|nr:hypothetical protein [Chryseobacterium manosquense]QNS40169.1 hypothetical protein H0S70_07080 [Chryseobacterium manosquense]